MDNEQQNKVMINGSITLAQHHNPSVKIERGMIIQTQSGKEAGFSAGVVVRQGEIVATYLLLGRLPVTSEYRMIPVELIERIDAEIIHLNVNCDQILQLPLHQPA